MIVFILSFIPLRCFSIFWWGFESLNKIKITFIYCSSFITPLSILVGYCLNLFLYCLNLFCLKTSLYLYFVLLTLGRVVPLNSNWTQDSLDFIMASVKYRWTCRCHLDIILITGFQGWRVFADYRVLYLWFDSVLLLLALPIQSGIHLSRC